MLYVYRRQPSVGARELARAIEAQRYRGNQYPIEQKVRRGDIVICWGERLNPIEGVKVLNGAPLATKYEDAVALAARGVPTIEVSRTRPFVQAPVQVDPALTIFERVQEEVRDFGDVQFNRASPVLRSGLFDLTAAITRLQGALNVPIPVAPPTPASDWIGRANHHVGGNDLLTPTPAPDYFAKKVELVKEFRIHSFQGKSIRAGVKAPREGATPHTWVRSWDGGWKIVYDGVTARQRQRDVAHAAVQALNLQFGAVDIGEKADGSLVVLEVNRAPGLEGGTIESYARAIEGWLEGDTHEG